MTRLFLLIALCAWTFGCGSRAQSPDLIEVKGTVTWKKKPLADAELLFLPTGDTKGVGAVGRTQADGTYELKYRRGGAGTMAGTYKVVISRRLLPDGTPTPPDYNVATFDSNARESLPAKYSEQDQTALTATVPSASGAIDFDL